MKLISSATKEKLRGGFYTPNNISSFILKWAFNEVVNPTLLEPSCGDGVFLEELKNGNYKYKNITAVEFDYDEAQKASNLRIDNCSIINNDFHDYCINTKQRFDIIIGNPPYIRYQYFDKDQQKFASQIFDKVGLKYSKLTNAWVSFIVGSSLLLNDYGKIGFVLPAEILQVGYAKTLREFLAHTYNKINIISFKKLVFPKIQQEVVLLLCEKNDSKDHLIEHIELYDATELKDLDLSKLTRAHKKIDFKMNKWTFYFLDQEEIDFLEDLQDSLRVKKLKDFAKVEVGITTGSNPFFTVPYSIVNKYDLHKYAKPLVGRSVQVPSLIFTEEDWENNRNNESRTHLLTFPKKDKIYEKKVLEYLIYGEQENIHKGYKCRIREEWQIIPSLRISDALFIRRNNIYPKFILNEARSYTTDTMHRVTIKSDINPKALIASYYNPITLAFTEFCGRSHGGGVLELMPSEVEDILLPYNPNNAELFDQIDTMIRSKKSINEIFSYTSTQILKENFNFSDHEIKMAERIWIKLSNRRLNRN